MGQLANLASQRRSPVATLDTEADTLTHEGGRGFTRTAESELYVLGASYLFGQPSFYEHPDERDRRFVKLVGEVDADWLAGFVGYLRSTLNIRSAAVVAACEYVKAGHPRGRKVVDSAIVRGDEPAEVIGYWLARHGKPIPQPVKRGVADALRRLGTERVALKYAGWSSQVAMADAVQLAHPKPVDATQRDLFAYLLAKRRGVPNVRPPESLAMHREREALLEVPEGQRRELVATEEGQARLRRAGVTWEWVAGTFLAGGMDARAWESVVGQMGVMALLRNLRNFDQAGISAEAVTTVASKLASRDDVRASRVLPLRFLQAWEATNSMRWGYALETGLEHSLDNVPRFAGRTVALTDVSASMTWGSEPWRQAAAFATACVRASDQGHLVAYSNGAAEVDAGAILRTVDSIRSSRVFGGGTQTVEAVLAAYERFRPDRVVVVTDEQAFGTHRHAWGRLDAIPVPIYTWNVQGYKAGWVPSGRDDRHTVAGLSDAGFTLIDALESGRNPSWPWER